MLLSNGKIKVNRSSIKDIRSAQKAAETSHLGPGYVDTVTPFGSDVKGRVDFGSKYKFKPKEGPAPGQYDIERSSSILKPRTKSALIRGRAT